MNAPDRTLQFSLRAMAFLVGVCGIGALALTRPSSLVAQLIFAATSLVYLLAITVSYIERSRSFAFGCALFGMSYLGVVGLVGDFDVRQKIDSPLLSTRLLKTLYLPIARPLNTGTTFSQTLEPLEYLFLWSGHCVLSWLLALSGGFFAIYIRERNRVDNANKDATEQ